jgi:hypothetical protein
VAVPLTKKTPIKKGSFTELLVSSVSYPSQQSHKNGLNITAREAFHWQEKHLSRCELLAENGEVDS